MEREEHDVISFSSGSREGHLRDLGVRFIVEKRGAIDLILSLFAHVFGRVSSGKEKERSESVRRENLERRRESEKRSEGRSESGKDERERGERIRFGCEKRSAFHKCGCCQPESGEQEIMM